MKRYGIEVKEILKRTVIVEADSCQEAIQKVEKVVSEDKILLEAEDFKEREINISDYWFSGEVPKGEDIGFFDYLNENGDVENKRFDCEVVSL